MDLIIFFIGVFVGSVITTVLLKSKIRSNSSGDLCITNDGDEDYIFLRAKVPISEFKKKMSVSFEVINLPNSR